MSKDKSNEQGGWVEAPTGIAAAYCVAEFIRDNSHLIQQAPLDYDDCYDFWVEKYLEWEQERFDDI